MQSYVLCATAIVPSVCFMPCVAATGSWGTQLALGDKERKLYQQCLSRLRPEQNWLTAATPAIHHLDGSEALSLGLFYDQHSLPFTIENIILWKKIEFAKSDLKMHFWPCPRMTGMLGLLKPDIFSSLTKYGNY